MGNEPGFACPVCRSELETAAQGELRCPLDGNAFQQIDGIWHFLPPERVAHYEQFVREYETVRRAEGRISPEPAYYRALPFKDLTGHHTENWRIRARSFQVLLDRAVKPLETRLGRPLLVLDLGAGNGWLSYQLARRGHRATAVDLLTNDFDGLGCHVHYDSAFTSVQAEFEHLPFPHELFDLVVFNASLHYSTDYALALSEALRVLRPEGAVAIVDSPIYRNASSGAQMVRERETQFLKQYGFASNSIQSENFLTYDRLAELESKLGLRWERVVPWYGLRWTLRPWRARLRGRREPARFMVLVGRRDGETGAVGARRFVWNGEDGIGCRAHHVGLPPAGVGHGTVAQGHRSGHSAVPLQPGLPRPLRMAAWRLITRVRYRLFARGRYDSLVLEDVDGRSILVLPGVFNPKLLRTGEILATALNAATVPAGSTVLDMGTGSGVGAVFAARWASRVTAVDLNPEAVRCARINALLNRVEDRVEVLEGDLFAPIAGRRFDVVLFNPPYYRGSPRDKLDMAWRSPDIIERFAAELPAHLEPGGFALVVLSTDGEQEAFLESFSTAGLQSGVVTRRDLGNEVATVYRVGGRP